MADGRVDGCIEGDSGVWTLCKGGNGCFTDLEKGVHVGLEDLHPLRGLELGDVGFGLLICVIKHSV